MKVTDMHIWFRQYAQQMGMQNVRAILPEQIDILLNTSVSDTVNSIIQKNINLTNDRVVTDNSKIGQINALSTLYRTINVVLMDDIGYKFSIPNINSLMPSLIISLINKDGEGLLKDYLFIDDFSLSYKAVKSAQNGYIIGQEIEDYIPYGENTFETNPFPVRLIDSRYLADTLNDFVLKPRLRSPIGVINGKGDKSINLQIYIDKWQTVNSSNKHSYCLVNNLLPHILTINYVEKPAIIANNEDFDIPNVECNLPEYLHVDVVKHAVDLYRLTITGALQAAQGQQQVQNQEQARNNYRNDSNMQ